MTSKRKKLVAMLMAVSMILTACGTTKSSESTPNTTTTPDAASTTTEPTIEASSEIIVEDNEIHDLVLARLASNEMDTFNYLYSQSAWNGVNLTAMWEGLLQSDKTGKYLPCLAENYETNDGGKTWTFQLRPDVKWVDVNGTVQADCNAYDYATGLEWVLNYYKNDSNNTSMPREMIEGATEYYEYTKSLSEEEAKALTAGEGSKFAELVGVETPDENTVIYHCLAEKPYFFTVCSYSAFYPLSQSLVDQLGVDGVKSMDNTQLWYNGAYLMTEYIQGNEKLFEPNPEYWDKDARRFDTVTVYMVDSYDVAFQLYRNGEIDYVDLTESMVTTINGDLDNELYDYLVPAWPTGYSYQMYMNFYKLNEDGTEDSNWNTAVANEAFRQSLYYGLELSEYLKRYNALEPLQCENLCYTKNMLVYTSDGTDYTDLVKAKLDIGESDGEHTRRWNQDKAEQYKKQAMEELSALGVQFPVGIDFYIPASNQTQLDTATVLKQTFSNCLGDDYVTLNIKTYISSFAQEVRPAQLHSIMSSGWGADYSDPQNFMATMVYGDENAYLAANYLNINQVPENENTKQLLDEFKTFTEMVKEADKITTDLDARYEAYAEAEAYMLNHALVVPTYYNIGWCCTKYNVHGAESTNKMVNWETQKDGYTREEMAACMNQ